MFRKYTHNNVIIVKIVNLYVYYNIDKEIRVWKVLLVLYRFSSRNKFINKPSIPDFSFPTNY